MKAKSTIQCRSLPRFFSVRLELQGRTTVHGGGGDGARRWCERAMFLVGKTRRVRCIEDEGGR